MATRKTTNSKCLFTEAQEELIDSIVRDAIENIDVEYDSEDIAKQIIANQKSRDCITESVSTAAIPAIVRDPRLLDNVRQCSEAVAASVADTVSNTLLGKSMAELGERIDAALAAEPVATKQRMARKIAQAVGVESRTVCALGRFILNHAPPADALTPIMLAGEQGCGKTYATRNLAEEYDTYFEVPCFNGMEARDFIGSFLPNGKGQLMWTDMGITRAFRSAASGKSTLLLVDELYRVADRERSIFLTMLSPVDVNGVEVYRLQIDNPQNGTTEVVEAPCHLLSIVATTNIGGQFNVDEGDWAGKERWTTYYVYANADQISQILSTHLGKLGIPTIYATNFTEFWQRLCELKKQGVIQMTPTVRTLTRAVRLARIDGSDNADTITHNFVRALKVIAPMWAGTDLDGKVNEAQLKLINDAAHVVFGVPQN